MQISPEFKKLIPPLSGEELAGLEASIVAEGIREPVIVWGEFIIDGHNRYEIGSRLGLKVPCVYREFADENAVKRWMIENQFSRRNLSAYQRGILALEYKGLIAERARERQATSTGGANPQLRPTLGKAEPIDTKRELAELAGISHGNISKIEKIQTSATPEIRRAVESGEKSINEAYKEVRATEKKVERKADIDNQMEKIEAGELPELVGKFEVISVDPPWPYGREYDPNGSRVANPYPEMSIEQIKKLQMPFADDSVCFLWTTHAFLPASFEILKEWGFEYKATMVWNKEKIGMGAWLRMQCEFCLVGIKGRPFWENTEHRDIITEPRREHSRKPESFFSMVEKITHGRRLEYFSRQERQGWEVFGNEVSKF